MQDQKRGMGMKANAFNCWSEQDPLKEVQVLGDHCDHPYVPAFNKGL